MQCSAVVISLFLHDTATAEIYTLSLHDALPISGQAPSSLTLGLRKVRDLRYGENPHQAGSWYAEEPAALDRKSTRLNSSHSQSSYAVFCLKKKIDAHSDDRQRPVSLAAINCIDE